VSNVGTIRTALHSAIGALTGLTTIQRYDALKVEDAIAVAKRRPCLVVVYTGRVKGDGPLAKLNQNTMRYKFSIVVVTENWRDGVSALSEATYGAEALSDALDEIRLVDICYIGDEPVRMRFMDESISAPPDRPVDGGPALYITNWETTEVLS